VEGGGYATVHREGCNAQHWTQAASPAPEAPRELTVAERVEAIHKGIHGGNSDPNRCVCAEKERGNYPDTPHRHYAEPPFACARCECKAYDPAVPPAPREPQPSAGDARERAHVLVGDGCRFGFSPHSLSCDRVAAALEAGDAKLAEMTVRATKAEAAWEEALNARKDEAIRGDAALAEVARLRTAIDHTLTCGCPLPRTACPNCDRACDKCDALSSAEFRASQERT